MKYHLMKLVGMSLAIAGLIFGSYAVVTAAEPENSQTPPHQLEPITVYGKATDTGDAFVAPFDVSAPSNQESYTKKSIETFGRQGNINVFKITEMSPSVNYTAVDALGTNENGFHDSLRIRGKKQTGPGGVKSYDGVPISGNPGGGKTIFDMENIESVDLYKGYIPVDKGLGFSNLAGKVDMNIRRPEHVFGADLSQTIGSDNFYRSFLRLDTGDIGNVSAFGSFSYTTSDKYKGEGDLERTNSTLGFVLKPSDKIKAELFVSHNRDDHHNYYNLTYAETKHLGQNFYKDFNTDRTSANYYDYNKQNFEDTAILANIEGALSSDSKISFKPYYLNDNGQYSYASGTNVIKWDIDHEVYGAVLKYEKSFSKELNTKLGYWAHRQQPPGPPEDQKKYTVGANGLKYAGYAVLADNDYHEFNSPFTEVSGQMGNFVYSAGVRYLNFKLGELKSYTNGTNAATSQDYDTAISNGTLDTWASVNAKYFREWLPSLYLGYNLSNKATIYVDYTRTYGLDVNLFPTYVQQRSSFVSKGVTLQSLWDKLDLETADNFDVGVKYKIGDICLNPNAFGSFVKNKQARIYDSSYKVTYPYNAADALGYGAEIAASGALSKELDFLVGLSYNKYYFTDDLKTGSNSTISSSGNQVPDAPMYMAKAALSYKIFGFVLTPTVKYMSARYGDVLHNEKISASTIVDFDISYVIEKVLGAKSVEFRITATNLFNQKYISAINTADDALAATNTAATYQTGAPFGMYANVNFKF
ncbi:MAG: TonB-dependent receptor [Desulfobacterales bacterium]